MTCYHYGSYSRGKRLKWRQWTGQETPRPTARSRVDIEHMTEYPARAVRPAADDLSHRGCSPTHRTLMAGRTGAARPGRAAIPTGHVRLRTGPAQAHTLTKPGPTPASPACQWPHQHRPTQWLTQLRPNSPAPRPVQQAGHPGLSVSLSLPSLLPTGGIAVPPFSL